MADQERPDEPGSRPDPREAEETGAPGAAVTDEEVAEVPEPGEPG